MERNVIEENVENDGCSGFEGYELRNELLEALRRKGFTEPTSVQEKVLELDDYSNDLIVRAKTGSGKTLAFLLPLLGDINPSTRTPHILILSPTRELTQQIAREAEWLVRLMDISVVSLVGGLEMMPQIRALREGAAIIVGTPGRTLDHINRGTLKTENIHSVVLDEGDQMLDMGFRDELEGILDSLPEGRRTWLFSATMPDEVRRLAMKYLETPNTISLVSDGEQHDDIEHKVYMVPMRKRFEGLVNVLLWERPKRGLVFCHTRMDAIEVSQKLQDEGFGAAVLHGEMTQRERNSVLSSFKSGAVSFLVATNVAARGLDVEGVTHVIQLGLPEDRETFVHRSGRTGRAGNEGINIILLSPLEAGRFKSMLRSSQMKIEWIDVPEVDKIREIQREIAEEKLLKAQPLPNDTTDYASWADDLLERAEAKTLITKLLSLINARSTKGYNLSGELARERDRRSRTPRIENVTDRTRGTRARTRPKGTVLQFKGGLSNGLDVGRVLRAICSTLDVERSEVGAIRMSENHVTVELLPLAFSRYAQNTARLAKWGLVPDGASEPAERARIKPRYDEAQWSDKRDKKEKRTRDSRKK